MALELLKGRLSELDENYVTCTCSDIYHEMRLGHAGDGSSVGPIRISWLVLWLHQIAGYYASTCSVIVGDLVTDGAGKIKVT
jgi:hypothetical protein